MTRDGDNFRVVDEETAAWALGQFFATHECYPQMGLPKVHQDHPVTVPARHIPPTVVWTPELRAKNSRSQTRRHAKSIGIRMSEMDQYRHLRRFRGFSRAEARAVIIKSRRPKS